MSLNRQLRTLLAVLVGLALVAVAVMAVQYEGSPGETAVTLEQSACSGNCETCPQAGTESCHEQADVVENGSTARVDAERCIGCVRCVNVAPEAFRMNPDTGKAEVIDGAPAESIERGARACPVDAISG